MFEHKFGSSWQVEQHAEVVETGSDEFTATFPKPRPGTIQPPHPQVRYNGREAVASEWVRWPHEPKGMVTLFFRLS